MDTNRSPYQVGAATVVVPRPGFFVRLGALPFWPKLWRESPEYGLGAIVWPLLLWVLVASTIFGLRAAGATRSALMTAADYYEREADPLLLEDGTFRVQGDRLLRYTDGGMTILIDPEETVSDEELAGTEHIVVRADLIRVRQRTQTREIQAADLSALLGDPVLLDADYMRGATDRLVWPTVAASYAVFATFGNALMCVLYALLVGLPLYLMAGQFAGLRYGPCALIALAVSATTVVLDLVLTLAGIGIPFPVLVWPLLMLLLGWIAISGRPREPRPTPH
jgi:hypothetical protein